MAWLWKVRERKEEILARLDRWMEVSPVCRLVYCTVSNFSRDQITNEAASIAFFAFLSIFPLILGLFSILVYFLPAENVWKEVTSALMRSAPASMELIEKELRSILAFQHLGSLISILILIWSGSRLFGALERSSNRAWGIRVKRPFFKRKLLHVGMTFSVGFIMVLSIALTTSVRFLHNVTNIQVSGIMHGGSIVLGFGLTFLVVLLVLKILPNRKTTWRMVWPGAFLVMILFECGKHAFVWYLYNVARYNRIYGDLASIIVLLLWIYLSAAIFLLGVEFSAELQRLRRLE